MTYTNMKKYIFYFATLGWILSLIVHLLSIADIDIREYFPFIIILHFGIFVVWIPTVLNMRESPEIKEFEQQSFFKKMNPVTFVKIIFKHTPTWITTIAMIGFYYAFLNFALFAFTQHGTPDIKDGQYVLQNHGVTTQTLTEQEYHHFKANEIKGFSGHWIAFYGLATALLFPFRKENKTPIEK